MARKHRQVQRRQMLGPGDDRVGSSGKRSLLRRRAQDNLGDWFELIEESIHTIDLIVYVPIESPDRIHLTNEYPKLRRIVDRRLRELLVDDQLGIVPPVLEVKGSLQDRVEQISRRTVEPTL